MVFKAIFSEKRQEGITDSKIKHIALIDRWARWFYVLALGYIGLNAYHIIVAAIADTAASEWGRVLAPIIAAIVSLFNLFLLLLVRKLINYYRNTLLDDGKNETTLSFIVMGVISCILLADGIFRIGNDLNKYHKDRATPNFRIEALQSNNLSAYLQSDWRCTSSEVLTPIFTKISALDDANEISKFTQTIPTEFSDREIKECFNALISPELITVAMDYDATIIFKWQLEQLDHYQRDFLNDNRSKCAIEEAGISRNLIDLPEIKSCNQLFELALSKSNQSYFESAFARATIFERQMLLQFAVITSNQILTQRIIDSKIPADQDIYLALAARYSSEEFFKWIKSFSSNQESVDNALLVAIKKYDYKDHDDYNTGLTRLIELGARIGERKQEIVIAHIPIEIDPNLLVKLIDVGTDINIRDSKGRTLLIKMIMGKMPNNRPDNLVHSIELLVTHGAKVNISDNDGKTALHYIGAKPIEVAKLLFDHGADVKILDAQGDTVLHALLRYSISNQEKVNPYIALLIDHGIDFQKKNNHGETAFARVSSRASRSTIELLLNLGANINDLDREGDSLLMRQVDNQYSDDFSNIAFLIENGAKVDITNRSGKTVLDYARGSTILQFLLAHGANINRQNDIGQTVLMRKVISGYDYSIKLILEVGADPNFKNKDGRSAIHYVKDKKIAQLLIDKGADINALDKQQENVLHHVTRKLERLKSALYKDAYRLNKYNKLHRFLIKQGVDQTQQNSHKQTPKEVTSEI